MKKIKMYLDTSVIGGVFDDEFKKYSLRITDAIKNGKVKGVISEVTIEEIQNAPDFIKSDFESYRDFLELIPVNDEVTSLAEKYIDEKIVSRKYYEDAMHIAFATVYNIDLLVSWNFKHIVNYNRIVQFNGVNIKNGYKDVMIYSPMEVLNEDE